MNAKGTYDRQVSLMNSSGTAFQKAINRILHLKKYRVRINKLNRKFLYRTNDFTKKESIAVNKTLCPKCIEDSNVCKEDRDERRRYYCKVLSQTMGENVRLYLPSQYDTDSIKERIKKDITQFLARNPACSQNAIRQASRCDFYLLRDCLNELTARGIIRCTECREQNVLVKRYSNIYD
jgi:hypothetical protein